MNAKDIGAVAALGEPARLALYNYVVARGEAGRDDAARAARISRALAAFHLDRLVAEGLLTATYRRRKGRTGPGAGRPAKLYSRAPGEITLSFPERRYELAARLLARAVSRAPGTAAARAVAAAATAYGRALGAEARTRAGSRPSAARLITAALGLLAEQGFEPVRDGDGSVRLRNCPFHALAMECRDLVCGMNLSLLRGVIRGLAGAGLTAVLDPQPGRCCVVLKARRAGA
jgi:predicted ArsR family transcriptional regulator